MGKDLLRCSIDHINALKATEEKKLMLELSRDVNDQTIVLDVSSYKIDLYCTILKLLKQEMK